MRAIELQPQIQSASDILCQAKTSYLHGNYDEAIALFQKLVSGPDPKAEAFRGLGFALHAVGKPAEALRVFERGLVVKRGDAELHFGRAVALQSLGESLKAIQEFEEVLKLNPNHVTAKKYLQTALAQHTRDLFKQGNFIWAEEMINRQLENDPKCADALALSVEFNVQMANYEDAKRNFRVLSESKPDHPAIADLAVKLGLVQHRERGWLY